MDEETLRVLADDRNFKKYLVELKLRELYWRIKQQGKGR